MQQCVSVAKTDYIYFSDLVCTARRKDLFIFVILEEWSLVQFSKLLQDNTPCMERWYSLEEFAHPNKKF